MLTKPKNRKTKHCRACRYPMPAYETGKLCARCKRIVAAYRAGVVDLYAGRQVTDALRVAGVMG